jgi:uncharacterized protein (TIGR03382 family)
VDELDVALVLEVALGAGSVLAILLLIAWSLRRRRR